MINYLEDDEDHDLIKDILEKGHLKLNFDFGTLKLPRYDKGVQGPVGGPPCIDDKDVSLGGKSYPCICNKMAIDYGIFFQ